MEYYNKITRIRFFLKLFAFAAAFDLVSSNIVNDTAELKNFNSTTGASIDYDTCQNNESCVRFCCTASNPCIAENYFNLTNVKQAESLKPEFKILRGKPKHGKPSALDDENWKFFENGTVHELNIDEGNQTYDHESYCLIKDDTAATLFFFYEPHEEKLHEKVGKFYPFCKR